MSFACKFLFFTPSKINFVWNLGDGILVIHGNFFGKNQWLKYIKYNQSYLLQYP